MNLNLILIG